MNKVIKPLNNLEINQTLRRISAPASKSMMQRAVAISLLCNGTTTIKNSSFSDDSKVSIEIVESLGAVVKTDEKNKTIQITSTGELVNKEDIVLNCNEAGLSLRMFSAIAALGDKNITLTGEGSLLSRPISMIENPLRSLGIFCETENQNGFLPVTIKGPFKGEKTEIDGSISSQFLTGLLIALPKSRKDTVLKVFELKSKPYIDMTIEILSQFGVKIDYNGDKKYQDFKILGNQEYKTCNSYTVEGDWSGAAFLLVAGVLSGGNIEIDLLNSDSRQADKDILKILKLVGVDFQIKKNSIYLNKVDPKNIFKSFKFDATECPDLFPPIVALASYCNGVSAIKGVHRLIHKESNRGIVLRNEFAKLGIRIDIVEETDSIIIHGGNKVQGAVVSSFNDHRIAMAAAVIAIRAESETIIENAECINKSYNDFYKDLDIILGN